jgi:hypothetical protein
MKSRTTLLFDRYFKLLNEQDEPVVTDDQQPENPNPVTSEEEDLLISKIIDAALYTPSKDDITELENLRLITQANAHRNIVDELIHRIAQIIDSPKMFKPKIPKEGEVLPLTDDKKEMLMKNMLDAALYLPDHNESNTLTKLKEVMDSGRYSNANEEVLGSVLNYIRPSLESGDLRQTIAQLDK